MIERLITGTIIGRMQGNPGTRFPLRPSRMLAMLSPQECSSALRENGSLSWILTDHLGSTSVTADASGSLTSMLLYSAFGETRYASGSTSTDYRYTGQREEAELGLYYYVARWYDPALGRFIQADTVVPNPGNPMDWDRYAYVRNNPVINTDPSGHAVPIPQAVYEISNIFLPIYGLWNLVVGAVCSVSCGVLPVHYESINMANGAIVGDSPAEILDQGLVNFGLGIVGTSPLLDYYENNFAERANPNSSYKTINSRGKPYPTILDPRTGETLPPPPNNLSRTPIEERVSWGKEQRYEYITEWYDRGYSTPEGGWDLYEIHHIIPREYGGSNNFENLVPVETEFHRTKVNTWWKYYQ